MNSLLVVALLALAIPALEARVAPQIIGGRNARVGEYPYQGSLQVLGYNGLAEEENYDSHTCGCVLISSTWLVTAAHCVGRGPGGLYVVMGLHMRGNRNVGAPVGYYISSIISHPGWNRRTLANDIALIRLQSRVSMNSYVRTIAMHDSGSYLDGASCVITGWGVTTTGGGSGATILQSANVRAMSVSDCQRYWRSTGPGHLCVWEPNRRGSCNGDSGGPAACNGRLAGVTSFGQRGCYLNTPSVYTRISAYRDWIRRYTGI